MDPAANAIALAVAAAHIGIAINRLRHFGEVPGKIYALKNEITDLEVVLRQISQAVEQDLLALDEVHGALKSILSRTAGHFTDITQSLERLANVCSQRKIKAISKSTIWYTEKAVFQGFRDDIAAVKATLNLVLSTANNQHLHHIVLELQKVTFESMNSGKSVAVLNRGLTDRHLALSSHIDQQHEALRDRIEELGQIFSKQQLQDTDAEKLIEFSELSQTDGDTVRVSATHGLSCRRWCPCACHTRRKQKLASPSMVEGVLGRLFIGYSGLPLQKEQCDFQGCQDQRKVATTVEYWFPSWFVSMNLRLHMTCLPRTGPEFLVSTTRRVPDSSQSITFAMQGNIEGLKHLFTQGLAGPRDVSNARGYTLLRWALYGGMHNYETVRFLLHEGAKVDEESYANVWDFVFRGKCTKEQQGALRCITEGGEGDWVEDQNFPLVHRIIFGMSQKSLAAELEENPRAIYLTDTQNRTALDWATARSQLADMALLIKHGASVNNMDVTGRTPVLHAVDTHDAETLHAVLKAGGNPNPIYPAGMFRSSPLTAAGFAGQTDLLKLLLDFEADPNACNPEGVTALHSIARTHNTDCAYLLLEYGADLNATSNHGHTPLTVAIMHNNHAVLRLFVDRCYEYMTSVNFKGPKLLPVVAEYADIETMRILASVHPLKTSYDVGWRSINSNRELLEKRADYDEKLGEAFEELIAVAIADAEDTKSVDSKLESGFFLSARSSFHSELAEAMSGLASLENTPTDSDGSEDEWQDTFEAPPLSPLTIPRSAMRSIGSPTSHASPNSPTAQRSPVSSNTQRQLGSPCTDTKDWARASAISSPLRREVSS